MKNQILVAAPCKVNLTLEITGKRADGYHTLESVMQAVSLCDYLEVTRAGGGIVLTSDDPALPLDAKNTAHRAAKRYLESAGITDGVKIHIAKRAPYEAGLGSASADAAGTLFALEALYGALGRERLSALGAEIGADVPFCLAGGASLASGIGEVLEPLPPLCSCFLALVKPGWGHKTPEMFAAFDRLGPPCRGGYSRKMAQALRTGTLGEIAALLSNDLERCADPEVSDGVWKKFIQNGAVGASMSGSGSAFYGIFAEEDGAQNAAKFFREAGFDAWLAVPVSHGPKIVSKIPE